MPATPQWHKRIAAIRDALATATPPSLDRPAIEKLFRLRQRRAQTLMKQCGGTLIGRSAVVSREELLLFLDAVEASLPPATKERRKGILVELAKARESEVSIPQPLPFSTLLPEGVTLPSAGKLLIEFDAAADLLSKVFALTQAAQKNIAAFESAIEVDS
jgi:hypothetical protein